MKALATYVVLALLVTGLGGWTLSSVVGPESGDAAWWAAGIALGVQLLTFTSLVALRRRPGGVLWVAVGAHAFLRLGVVLVAALWLTGYAALDPAVLLLSLVGFLFVLLILESAVYRVGMRN